MKKIAIVTDSNSGITEDQGKELGIHVLPMPFYINEELFFENISLTQEEFYQKLEEDAEISTSQPSPGAVLDLWDKILEEYEEIVHIPMSSGLSSTCETAMSLAKEYDGRVQVVDNKRISVTMAESVTDAVKLRNAGKTAPEIKEILEREWAEATIYLTVDTLKYLKKGGRITPAAAALGTVLNLKPVLTIQGEKLDAFAKVRGWKAAKKTMLKAIQKDIKTRFEGREKELVIGVVYAGNHEEAQEWKAEVEAAFPEYEIKYAPLSLSVACHIGKGALAITCTKKAEVM